jgi:hypothetical protein
MPFESPQVEADRNSACKLSSEPKDMPPKAPNATQGTYPMGIPNPSRRTHNLKTEKDEKRGSNINPPLIVKAATQPTRNLNLYAGAGPEKSYFKHQITRAPEPTPTLPCPRSFKNPHHQVPQIL